MSDELEPQLIVNISTSPGQQSGRISFVGRALALLVAGLLGAITVCADPACLTNFTASVARNQTVTFSFSVTGGSNGIPYDIYKANNVPQTLWSWLGPTFSGNSYTFSNQPLSRAFFTLGPSPVTMAVAWGDDFFGQTDVPFGLSNVVAVAGGYDHSVALRSDGTVVAWGEPAAPANYVPTNLPLVRAVAAGWNHNVALLYDSTVTAWGVNGTNLNWHLTEVPEGLTNVTAIAANSLFSLALRTDGTVVGWGYGVSGETNSPSGLSNVVAAAAGGQHSLALKDDGFVVAWGQSNAGQCSVPAGLSNVVAVAAGWNHSLALRNDGSVAAWGDNTFGESAVPAGLSNVIAIAAGGDPFLGENAAYSMALRSDGTVAVWGESPVLEVPVGMDGVMALGSGAAHALAVRYGRLSPVLIHAPRDQYETAGGSVSFAAQAMGIDALQYQWQYGGVNIPGATNATLQLTNVTASQQGNYLVIVSGGVGSVTSSNASFTLVTPPVITALTQPSNQFALFQSSYTLSVAATAPGQSKYPIGYQWQLNGTNIAGAKSSNCTFVASAASVGAHSVVITNAAGSTNATWQVQVALPGSVWGWGENADAQADCPALTNVSGIAAGEFHSVAVKDDGTVAQWGYAWGDIPANLTNVIAVAAGYGHSLALRADGTVAAWGDPEAQANWIPTNLFGAKAIAAGWNHNLALLTNGSVTAWGVDGDNLGWHLLDVPEDLTNAVAVAANSLHSLALRADGTVAAWGYGPNGETNVPAGLSNVVAIAAGGEHNLALKSDGAVVAWGSTNRGQCAVPAGLSNVTAIAAGWTHSAALKNDGTLVTWGDNTHGQTNTLALTQAKLLAAGGNHTLASVFSPLVQYPVDVTRDVLLIYNSNSTNSTALKDYYLGHRPMIAGVNVLGVACDVGEFTTASNCLSQIVAPVLNWLTNNPTKRPQYLVLFFDIPTRILNYTPTYPSVTMLLHDAYSEPKPFVNYINGGALADCTAYVDKLADIGTNYSPGRLVISASAGGYGNTNYLVDNVSYGGCTVMSVAAATNGLAAAGVSPLAIFYLCGCEGTNQLSHITGATNVAGYICWGSHSSLGGSYASNGGVRWSGNSGWWLIETIESFNGVRGGYGQGNFTQWFSSIAFGGTDYSNTPVGAVSHVEEPGLGGVEESAMYFGLWAAGKNFGMCAWNARNTRFFQAIGDPLVSK